MKKCILLLLLMLFTYDVMFGSKSGICVPSFSQEKYETNIMNEIFDNVARWGIIFYNFIQTSEECQQKIIKNECTSIDIFYDIWQLCLDNEKQFSKKNACEVKCIVYTYILHKIDILKKNFEFQVRQHLNQAIGKSDYATNDFFSCDGLKKSFIVHEIVDGQEEGDDRVDIGVINSRLEETEQNYKKICDYQDYIEEFHKKCIYPNKTNDEIFEFEDVFNEKTIDVPFLQKKIKQALTTIFNDKNRQENQVPEETDKKQKNIKGRSYQAIKKSEELFCPDNLLDGLSGVKEIISFKEKKTIIKK